MVPQPIGESEARRRVREVADVYLESLRKLGCQVPKENREEANITSRIAQIAWETVRKTYDIVEPINRDKILMIFDSNRLKLSREETHSIVYLLEREKNVPFPGYRYVPYRGPYSELLQGDVNALTSLGNLATFHSHIRYAISGQGRRILEEKKKEGKEFSLAYDGITTATAEILKNWGKDGLVRRAYDILSQEMAERMHRW